MSSSQSHHKVGILPAFDPFWGAITANSNFCEENYVVTKFIGELINSITNLAYIIYGIYGLRKLQQRGIRDVSRAIPYWGLISVGLCSTAFHVSLKYHTQMMDDLSMLFTTTPVLHRILTVNSTPENSRHIAIILAVALFSLITYHVIADELILHSAFFICQLLYTGLETFKLINIRTDKGSVFRSRIWGIVRFGAVVFVVGISVWLIDGWLCNLLRNARAKAGAPLAYLLELHGWWHICTAVGAYLFIATIDHLASGENHEILDENLAWPAQWASRSVFAPGLSRKVPENSGKIE